MSARSIRFLIISSIATLAFAVAPGLALAGTDAQTSSVDAVSLSASTGSTSSSSATTDASDSPTVDSYSGGGESVPPPVDCNGSTDSGSTSSGSTSSGSTDSGSCDKIVECSSADTDGRDANGKPCVECSSFDTDGKDASGSPCVPVTEQKTCAASTDSIGGGSTTSGTVCGGGGVGEETPTEQPVSAPEPVSGGGAPDNAPSAVGGGGPELPFTGLPLMYAIYAGFGLMIAGAALWLRGRFGKQG
jgi:hypothetical protein